MRNLICVLILGVLFSSCAGNRSDQNKNPFKPIDSLQVSKHLKKNSLAEKLVYADLLNYKINLDHFPAKGQNHRVRFLVMHYTAADLDVSIRLLTEREVSSHYLVSDSIDQEIMLLVSEDERAWHAGYSYWQGRENLNDTSIGIEIVNDGFHGDFEFIPFKPEQIKKVGALAQDIVRRYDLCPTCIVGHSDIAPQRKYDPGPLFPWGQLYYQYGVGAWPDRADVRKFMYEYFTVDTTSMEFYKKIQGDLNRYGYDISVDGVWGEQSERVVRTFQYHFRPEKYDGQVDAETYAILQALLKKYMPEK